MRVDYTYLGNVDRYPYCVASLEWFKENYVRMPDNIVEGHDNE